MATAFHHSRESTSAMLNFIARRIVQLIPTLFFVSILIFSLQHLLPGDPALVMAGEERDPNVIAHIRAQYRLDQPIPVQYVYWVKGVLSGDFGESLRIKVPVLDLIKQKLPVTMQLASMAIVIAFLVGIPAGIVSAVKKGTAWDYGANLFALWGISTPNFWLGIMLIFLFSIELGTLLSGAVLTEQIFSIPGFGKLIVDAVFNRDYAVVQGVVLVTATIYITLNLIADIAYILVNPRLRA